jgi:hypothetical protein
MKDTNIQLVAKDSKTYTVCLKRNGLPIPVSNWSIYFTVKNDFLDTDAQALVSKNILIPSNSESEAGIAYLPLTSEDTDLEVGEFFYDLKFVDLYNRITVMRGKLVILPSIRIN